MTKNNKLKNYEMFEKITTVGINLSVISSIVKFLDVSMNDSTNFSNADIHNLVITLKKMLNLVISDYYEIEQYIDA